MCSRIPGYVLIAFRLSVCSAMEPSGVLRAAKALRYLLREEEECIIGAIAALPSKQREMLHTCFSSVADVFGESSASAAQFDSASGSAAISTASASSHMEATPATVNLHALDGLLDDDGKDDDDIIIIDDVGDAAATAVCSPEPVPVSAKKHKAECKTAKPLTFGRPSAVPRRFRLCVSLGRCREPCQNAHMCRHYCGRPMFTAKRGHVEHQCAECHHPSP